MENIHQIIEDLTAREDDCDTSEEYTDLSNDMFEMRNDLRELAKSIIAICPANRSADLENALDEDFSDWIAKLLERADFCDKQCSHYLACAKESEEEDYAAKQRN